MGEAEPLGVCDREPNVPHIRFKDPANPHCACKNWRPTESRNDG